MRMCIEKAFGFNVQKIYRKCIQSVCAKNEIAAQFIKIIT